MEIRVHHIDFESLKKLFKIDTDKLSNYLVNICGNINPEYFRGILNEKLGMDNMFLIVAYKSQPHIRFNTEDNINPFVGFTLFSIEPNHTFVHLICGRGTGSLLFREIALVSKELNLKTIKLNSLMDPLPIYIRKYGFKPTKKNTGLQVARQMILQGDTDDIINMIDPNGLYEENGIPMKVRVTRILKRTS